MPKFKRRPNGSGTAIKRGKTFQARVVVSWYVKDGKKLPKWETKDGFRTRQEAWAYCEELKEQAKKTSGMSFLALYEAWEEIYSPRVTSSTMDCYKAARNHFSPVHPLDIKDIGIDELQDCVDNCGHGKRTRENMKALAGLLYKYAIPRLLVNTNLAPYIHTGENDKGTRIPFSTEQIKVIEKNVGKIPYADYILVLIYTGFRPAELFAMKQDAFISRFNALTGGSKTDAGKDRVVPVAPQIAPILAQRRDVVSDWLFPRENGTQMNVAWFRTNAFYPALDLMGMSGLGLSPYSCRHSFANLLKNAKGSDTDKAALMGHTSIVMTKYYQSPDMESLKAITDSFCC